MVTGRKMEAFNIRTSGPCTPQEAPGHMAFRNLRKSQLGGVIFGCTNSTIKECLLKQIFGLPFQHFMYVKNIDPGLPLFLFNYSDRRLHGIFEAASPGQMNINPYGWSKDASDRTQYPAQVQICVRLQCQVLPEDQFKRIISDNYYSPKHFWFELDHAQASKLTSLLASLAISPRTYLPQNTAKGRTLFRAIPSSDGRDGREYQEQSNSTSVSSDASRYSDGENLLVEAHLNEQAVEHDEKDIIYMKLKELALNRERSLVSHVDGTAVVNDMDLEDAALLEAQTDSELKNEITSDSLSESQSAVAQLIQRMEKLEAFKHEQTQKMGHLEQKLVEAETEIQQLKDRYMMLESLSCPSLTQGEAVIETSIELNLDTKDLIFLLGGYDGRSWLSAFNAYSPSQDVMKYLKPMNSVRSYASVANLNGELYVFGGGNGTLWYDSVESYNPANNQWTARPSLNVKKGSLAGVTLDNKIFAIGGGNGFECFADVEMFDLDIGRWITTRSMLQKRFALAAVELNGVFYAVGGYDGKDYLKTAERFDPREHSWTKIGNMNTKRGCLSAAVLNEKLYAFGGFDGTGMVPSVEIFDPRLGTWVDGDPMHQPRGYSAAAVVNESIYIIGGVKDSECIVDTVEKYNEGHGWEATNLKAIGKRCFSSAIVL